MPRRKNYYLLDMGEYEKVVNKWNKYGKQNEIITINRIIKDQVCMEDYIHKNKVIQILKEYEHKTPTEDNALDFYATVKKLVENK